MTMRNEKDYRITAKDLAADYTGLMNFFRNKHNFTRFCNDLIFVPERAARPAEAFRSPRRRGPFRLAGRRSCTPGRTARHPALPAEHPFA